MRHLTQRQAVNGTGSGCGPQRPPKEDIRKWHRQVLGTGSHPRELWGAGAAPGQLGPTGWAPQAPLNQTALPGSTCASVDFTALPTSWARVSGHKDGLLNPVGTGFPSDKSQQW